MGLFDWFFRIFGLGRKKRTDYLHKVKQRGIWPKLKNGEALHVHIGIADPVMVRDVLRAFDAWALKLRGRILFRFTYQTGAEEMPSADIQVMTGQNPGGNCGATIVERVGGREPVESDFKWCKIILDTMAIERKPGATIFETAQHEIGHCLGPVGDSHSDDERDALSGTGWHKATITDRDINTVLKIQGLA